MVISSVGDIPFDKLVRLIERYFGDIPGDPAVLVRERQDIPVPRQKVIDMDTYQNHCIIGNVAYDYTEDKRLAFLFGQYPMGDGDEFPFEPEYPGEIRTGL